jgi:hypothetical protein
MNMQYQPQKVGKIVIACVILHNIAIDCKEYEADPNYVENPINLVDNVAGNAARSAFLNIHFG